MAKSKNACQVSCFLFQDLKLRALTMCCRLMCAQCFRWHVCRNVVQGGLVFAGVLDNNGSSKFATPKEGSSRRSEICFQVMVGTF